MQTHEWEALLHNTTPGPWEAKDDHGGPNLFSPTGRLLRSDSCGDVSGDEDDVRLAAHAPAAVAEVIRLRREINEIRRFIENFPLIPPLVGMDSTEDRAYEMQEIVIHALTHILEGEA